MKSSIALLSPAASAALALLAAPAAAAASGGTHVRRQLSYEKIAGYGPSSQVRPARRDATRRRATHLGGRRPHMGPRRETVPEKRTDPNVRPDRETEERFERRLFGPRPSTTCDRTLETVLCFPSRGLVLKSHFFRRWPSPKTIVGDGLG